MIPSFAVLPGIQLRRALHAQEKRVIDVVDTAYRGHGSGDTVNTPEHSAMLVLNDDDTGYPFACMESSIIRTVRTAALAALAADWLSRDRQRPVRLGFVGLGLIARHVHTYLVATGWRFEDVAGYDPAACQTIGFRSYVERRGGRVRSCASAQEVIEGADMVVFATVAGQPHVHDPAWFAHNPVVLHVSLRDLAPEVILSSANVTDDTELCLNADTSPHLAERQAGNRDFLCGTLFDVMTGVVTVPPDRPVVFSPFGLPALDLAVGKHVYNEVRASGNLSVVDGFFTGPIFC
jgi:ornithine cyclodeaminase/alanine dehydrogenase-like protein (mu-crystallin family)